MFIFCKLRLRKKVKTEPENIPLEPHQLEIQVEEKQETEELEKEEEKQEQQEEVEEKEEQQEEAEIQE